MLVGSRGEGGLTKGRRYASLPNIMKAKKKPMEKKKLSDYNIEFKKRLETVQVVGMFCPLSVSIQTTNPI